MTDYRVALDQLKIGIATHPSVKSYQEARQELMDMTDYEKKSYDMKRQQQDFYLFQKIDKEKAAASANQEANALKQELDCQPIIEAYRCKMQDASDLIQYITGTIEDKLNKELNNGKS
ncbi:YlbF family regulator [Streptococcus ictaluri]|uniref:PF06133 family protein n=1 Tax=Streptococcus ictaluri 707-05 TaxID=764299 RepID=G5K0R5_9STRE|nr:YlbF family regulator [Streptococcus ictaluri]EHI70474.1 hypothetical protein STRIC_0191 [Streptococcus ictaluri 707-05]